MHEPEPHILLFKYVEYTVPEISHELTCTFRRPINYKPPGQH